MKTMDSRFRSTKRRRAMNRKRILTLVVVSVLAVLAIAVRFLWLDSKPGWELDEVVYAKITVNLMQDGYPWLTNGVRYLSHPPFFFELLKRWFEFTGVGIWQGRVLSAMTQVIGFLALYFALNKMVGRKGALISTIFALFDGWIVFTGRIGWMENSLVILIVLSVWLYSEAVNHASMPLFVLAGILIGISATYKHIGVFLFLAIPLFWLFTGRLRTKENLAALVTAFIILFAYVGYMTYKWDGLYLTQTENQLLRTLGQRYSPGLNYGFREMVSAISSRYWIFFTDILVIVIGVPWTLVQAVKAIRGRYIGNSILLAWATAAIVFLSAISMKSPHYFILMLVPLYALVGSKLKLSTRQTSAVLAIFVLMSLITWTLRIASQNDNLLKKVQNYAETQIPEDAVVFTTEPICSVIRQPNCIKLEGLTDDGVKAALARADWVLEYQSTTQKFPKVLGGLQKDQISGFKDTVTIFVQDDLAYFRAVCPHN